MEDPEATDQQQHRHAEKQKREPEKEEEEEEEEEEAESYHAESRERKSRRSEKEAEEEGEERGGGGGGGGERVSKGGLRPVGWTDGMERQTGPETAHYGRRMREECGGSGLLSRYNKYRIGSDRIGSAGKPRQGPTYRSWRRERERGL